MDTVLPFRAWRYGPNAGDQNLLVAPPYDVIGPELQSRLYARSRHNVVRVDLGMTTPSDSTCDNRYTRAAAQLEEWKKSGVLLRDQAPALTFVEEQFTGPDGRARVRHGFLAALRIHAFSEEIVYPHEQTFSGPKADRWALVDATAMSLSPVFMLYDLPADPITTAWAAGPGARPPATEIASDDGNITKLWPTSDPALLEIVAQSLQDARFVIADGHHRYETALRYRDHRRERAAEAGDAAAGTAENDTGEAAGAPPAYEYVLAYLSNMADTGLAIYATHRLIAGVDEQRLAALPQTLASTFALRSLTPAAAGAAEARAAVERYLDENRRGAFGVWVPAASAVYGLTLLDGAAAAAATPGHTTAYQQLDVNILQKLILEPGLGIPSEGTETEERISYFKDAADAFESLEKGEFQAGFFMSPTGLEQVREVAFAGERMPQKATFFYPKLPTGLVFQDLSASL